jgi:hypothetical protein
LLRVSTSKWILAVSNTERMKASFADFEQKFGGKVFIVFRLDGEIANKEIIREIKAEAERK